jgi:hypothetical protein
MEPGMPADGGHVLNTCIVSSHEGDRVLLEIPAAIQVTVFSFPHPKYKLNLKRTSP